MRKISSSIKKRLRRHSTRFLPALLSLQQAVLRNVLRPLVTQSIGKGTALSTESHAVLKRLPVEALSEPAARAIDRAGTTARTSFTAELNRRTLLKIHGARLPEWELNDTEAGQNFAQRFGFRVPATYFTGVPFGSISLTRPAVLKPLHGAGSKGVYVYIDANTIYNVERRRNIGSLQALNEEVRHLLDKQRVRTDEWIVEEYIRPRDGLIPPDLKCYAFYGEIGLVLELNRDEPDIRYCFRDSAGRQRNTGKYEKTAGYRRFAGEGLTSEEAQTVTRLSRHVAAPFVRIDLMRGEHGLFFGEFTPRPGHYHLFSSEVDEELGDMFIRAEARLHADLFRPAPH